MMTFNRSTVSRRGLLKLGVGLAAAGFAARHAFAATDISKVTITPSKEITPGAKYKRAGKLRIGVSNGFSGNTWRTECMASLRNEASKHPEIADLIIVDGQGDITKQVNDIRDLISQQVDAILVIPNSSTAVAPALARAMRANIPVIPFNLDVSGEQWCSYIGTDPVKKGVAWGKFMTEALDGKGKIVVLGGLPGNSGSADVWKGAQTNSWQGDRSAGDERRLLAGGSGESRDGRSHRRLSANRRHFLRRRPGRRRRGQGHARGGAQARADYRGRL